MRTIELLSPAKNLDCGMAAINHGADAVYIGAPRFSARAAAGVSVADIGQLARYAHRFRAKVLVALNTVLTDAQLPEAERLIRQLYEAGADALIVQDMGILQMPGLPPIALHASTQADNRTAEKVRFLEQAGFSRVVLARELSLEQIRHIAARTQVELEVFIHGALCVSYSGRCYMSQAACGRSANRGECAQMCRLPYDLLDADGRVLVRGKHLLSLKDLNQSDHLRELIEAGVTSLKIEGRLKEKEYVQNITAHYRRRLDAILEGNTTHRAASSGRTVFFFDPAPAKSFNRGFTDYFLTGRRPDIMQPDTPKSLGEPVGRVAACNARSLRLQGKAPIHNGDGLCFVNRRGELEGFRVNRVEGADIFPLEMPRLQPGATVYRNRDADFKRQLQQPSSAERRIRLDICLQETEEGILLRLTDEDGTEASLPFACDKQPARNPERAQAAVQEQLSKLGNTIYTARHVEVRWEQPCFFPNAVLNDWRRQAVERLDAVREQAYRRPMRRPGNPSAPYPASSLDYTANVTNHLARDFYRAHGVQAVEPGFEVQPPPRATLMHCKHCIKYALGWCPRQDGTAPAPEPLYLRHGGQRYRLAFDCARCEMRVMPPTSPPTP